MIPELASKKSMPSLALRTLLLNEASQPFQIMQGPLLRVKLVRVSEDEHVLLITMHHAVTDGWSTGILWRELSAAYNAFHKGQVTVGLPPLPIQYADFATWQRQWLAQGVMSDQMKFWRRHLEGSRAVWDFPTDFFRPAVPSGNSERVPISFKPEAIAAMKSLSGQVIHNTGSNSEALDGRVIVSHQRSPVKREIWIGRSMPRCSWPSWLPTTSSWRATPAPRASCAAFRTQDAPGQR